LSISVPILKTEV